MKVKQLVSITLFALTACSNLPPDDSIPFKAYPNPYNPAAGSLTIVKLNGTYATTDQYDFSVLDYNLGEVYRANVIPNSSGQIIWTGIDSTGTRLAPGNYYIKVVVSGANGIEGADAMFKLTVQ